MKQLQGTITVCKVGVDTPEADWLFYCGRNRESCPAGMIFADLGNPYRINEENTRGMVCDAFALEYDTGASERAKVWRKAVSWMIEAGRAGQSIALFCHCHPFRKSSPRCHCDKLQGEVLMTRIFDP